MIYIKISLPGEENGYIDTPENAKTIIDEIVSSANDGDFEHQYTFKAVEISEDEFNLLPEFKGF